VPSDHHPQAAGELRDCARHLIQQPLTCKEHDPDIFRLIRRHEAELDRGFTQRLGYRLHVDADTARLFKTGYVPDHRPLRARTGRAFHPLEYALLALVLGATAAGPDVISLRDLVEQVRSAAVEAEIRLEDSSATRRALVTVLQWMVLHGLAIELYAGVDVYASDETADAVLKLRPDRIALLSLPTLVSATDPHDLLARAERPDATRQWMRCRLVEDPVLYRSDLSEAQWSELRRRLGEEERLLDEMFGLVLESRAEGVAAIDPSGALAEQRFPTGGTVGHAALLLLDALRARAGESIAWTEVVRAIGELIAAHGRGWSKDLVSDPARLARQGVDLLVELRLAERIQVQRSDRAATIEDASRMADHGSFSDETQRSEPVNDALDRIRMLPAAARFLPVTPESESTPNEHDVQGSLW